MKGKFTLENAKTANEVRYITAIAYEFYINGNGNEMDIVELCGLKTRDDYLPIIFESKNMAEAVTKAVEVWQKENNNDIAAIEEFKKLCECETFEKIVYFVTYPEIKGAICISNDLFRILRNRILLKGEDGVLVKTRNGNLIRISLMHNELFEGIKVFKEKIYSIDKFCD